MWFANVHNDVSLSPSFQRPHSVTDGIQPVSIAKKHRPTGTYVSLSDLWLFKKHMEDDDDDKHLPNTENQQFSHGFPIILHDFS